MAVVVETTLGDITLDLYIEERPTTCMNFLKLCKIKYYNFCLFHSVQQNFIAQTGDPSGSGHGGSSIFHYTQGNSSNYYEAEKLPKIKHNNIGTVSMVNCGNNMLGSQFFITLGKDLQSLDGEHCVFGEVTEGHEILRKFNEVICDQGHRPYQDIRITHTVILEDPFDDPPGLKVPDSSPELTKEVLANSRIAPDEEIDETAGLTAEEVEEMQRKREAQAQATILEIVGDLPDADIAPPENVLFVCKLNPVTTDDDLEIIFSRFGKIVSCEVIRDKNTGDSLQYAFVEFDNRKACEDAYFKMDNVLIDDRRIHVDFSQSVSKLRWKGKGRLEHLDDGKSRPDYANYDRKREGKDARSPESSRQRHGESDSRTHNRIPNRRENDRSTKVSRENNISRHDGRHERSNERHTRVYSDLGRDRYHRSRESHDSRERYRSEVNRENSYRYKQKHNERERYRNERRKDVYYREDKYKKKSKSESSDSEGKVSSNEDIHNKGTRRKIQDDLDYGKVNYSEKESLKEKHDAEQNVEVKNVCRVKKHTRKSSSSSETENESVSSSDDETRKGRDRAIPKVKQQETSCEVTKTRDKTQDRRSPFEEMLPQHSVAKYDNRKRKASGSDEEKHITGEDKVNKRKVRHDQEDKCEKLKKEEKLNKIKHTSNCSNEKAQTQDKRKHDRNREAIVGSGSDVVRDKRKNRRNSSDSHESEEKSASVRSTGKNNKKRERNNSTSTERRSSRCKHRSGTRDDSESDEHSPVKKSNSVKNKHDSPRRAKKNSIKTKNKKVKPTKKREIVRKKKKRRDKRNKSSSSSRSSDSETVSSSSTSSSSSSSSTSSSSSGSESSDSSSSSSSSTSSSSSDDNRRLKHRKKVSKISAIKKPKRGTVPVKKTKKERRKVSDVSGEDSRKTKGKVQKKKSEMVGRNNIEKHVKVKSRSKRKRVAHSSDSSSESESSEDSIRDTRKRKKVRK